MIPEDFIAARKRNWERLTVLLDRTRMSGLAILSAEEIVELGRLYRTATSDLAVARRDFASHRVAEYLNGLVARGHGVIYQERATRWRTLLRFVTHTFPIAFRQTWGATLASFLMFFIPALIGFVITLHDPAMGPALFPGAEFVIDNIRNRVEWWQDINDARAASSTFIMTNNIQVALLAFAGGVLLGTITLYVLYNNGMMLGVIAGAAQAYGFSGNLWGFVAAHGVIELSVIFIAGGAGLQLGWAVVRPGLLTRRAALVVATRRAMNLLLGCVPLLVIAGMIEGFISPSPLPVWVKLAVALGSGVALYSYLLLSGRDRRRTRPQHVGAMA